MLLAVHEGMHKQFQACAMPHKWMRCKHACCCAGPTAVVDALFLFWASFLRHHSSTVLQHDFEALAQRQAEQRHFAGLLRLFQHYSVMLKGNFQDDLYARFEQLAVKVIACAGMQAAGLKGLQFGRNVYDNLGCPDGISVQRIYR